MNPSPLDLVTVSDANSWIFGSSASIGAQNAFVLQMLISALSLDFLRRTGRASQNGVLPTQSPFNQAISYTESYTGNGNELLQLRNFPILSVQSVTIGGSALQQSTGSNVPGWYIEDSGKFLGFRLGAPGYPGGWNGWTGVRSGLGGAGARGGWPKDIDCIQVQYTAGFAAQAVLGELQTIPSLPPAWVASTVYANGSLIFDGTNVQIAQVIAGNQQTAAAGTVTPPWNGKAGAVTPDGGAIAWTNIGSPYSLVVNVLPWLADGGVTFFIGGAALTPVNVAPITGQYFLQGNGSYLFAAADAGKQVQISYSAAGTPFDIKETILRWVNLIYKRRGWEGIRSLMQKDAGSTVYTSFEVDPSFEKCFSHYRRRA
jgi:hypothetical protein